MGDHCITFALFIAVPDHPFLDGNLSYTLTRDHICGTANMSIEYKVTTGWKSLAPISKITGYIKSLKIITVPFGEIEIEEIVFFQDLATNVRLQLYMYIKYWYIPLYIGVCIYT